ncbi:MAG: UDP-N-acetylmuramate dehydrogenase [Alphaproteobacteria bacterium]|nr:UDP-N-acetylmuramate dehydrogenase [Alphaproteobacteria bacterium]
MAAARRPSTLIDRLPPVRGRYTANAPLDRVTWFRVGGPAEVMFRPADRDDLAAFLAACPADVPLTVIGVGSNLLVRDGGIAGVVVRLGGPFASIEPDSVRAVLTAGAGALDANVALVAAEAGVAGIEFLVGVPGTIGGALRMNAGCYGAEMKDVVSRAVALDRQGRTHEMTAADIGFGYRRSKVPPGWIFTSVTLDGRSDQPAAITRHLEAIRAEREASQPLRTHTGGSTFKNPPGAKAWELIDRAGCRGLHRGAAVVSEKHCNFLINEGGARAADLEALGEEVRRRVAASTGTALEWEIVRVGEHQSPLAAVEEAR